MKKRSAKRTKVATKPAEPGHLDDTLTEVTTTAARKMKAWRVRITVILGAVILLIVIAALVNMLSETATLDLNQRLYELFEGPLAQEEGYVPPADKLEQLVADAKGSTVDKLVLKTVGDHYIKRADELEEKTEEEPPSASDAATREDLLQKASQLAEEAASRYPDDPDIQTWAAAIREKVEGERKTDWLPPARSFKPSAPRAVESPEEEPVEAPEEAAEGGTEPPATEKPPAGEAEGEESATAEPPAESAEEGEAGENAGPSDETPQ